MRRPELFTLIVFVAVILIGLTMAVAYELNKPLEVFLPTFDTVDVTPAPLIDLGELGIE